MGKWYKKWEFILFCHTKWEKAWSYEQQIWQAMESTVSANYNSSPTSYRGSFNPYPPSLRRALPPVNSNIERKMCVGRVWIFLVLGVLLFVLGLISLGIYINMGQLTTSLEYTHILPHYVPAGAVSLIDYCLLPEQDDCITINL